MGSNALKIRRSAKISHGTTFAEESFRVLSEDPGATWLILPGSDGERSYSYRELSARMADFRRLYTEWDVREGDIVLIILKESLDLFASFFAGIVHGALPAYFAYPSPKQSAAAFVDSVAGLARHNEIKLVVGFNEVTQLLGQELPCVSHTAVTSHSGRGETPSGSSPVEAFLQFSSGTTGAKKGVRIPLSSLFHQIDGYRRYTKFDGTSRVVSWLPHYHDMGLIACMLMPFLEKVPIVMMSPFDWVKHPEKLLELSTRHRGTHLWLPNFALGHLTKSVSDAMLAEIDLGSVRQLVCCSEPVLHETVRDFVKKFRRAGLDPRAMRNCYAMAENTFAMTTTEEGPIPFVEVDPATLRKRHKVQPLKGGKAIASVGRPLPNVRIRIAKDEGEEAGDGVIGEILVRSDCMLEGYHNNPEESRKALRDGWFHTGDLGFKREGAIYVTGRKKDMIIVGGENIYPQDIELILNEEPGLVPGRNLAFGVDDVRVGTERIVVLAETEAWARSMDTAPLRAKILGALNVSISEVVLLPSMTLKKGTAGKISRHLNRLEYLKGAFGSGPGSGDLIAGLVQGAIPKESGAPAIGRDTPLMSSGIVDSFAFTTLVKELESHFGVFIPESLWQPRYFETLSEIERTIERARRGDAGDDHGEVEGRRSSLALLKRSPSSGPATAPWTEWLINHLPWPSSRLYRILLRMAGVEVGHNVRFLGRLRVKIRGDASRIRIGDDVTLGDGVDLRNRENGAIVLRDRVYIDDGVRIVAARDGGVEVGFGTEIGSRTVINSGGSTRIGEFCMIAAGVQLNASSHGTTRGAFIKAQPHVHGVISIGNDVWIGAGASVVMNSSIGEGAVVSSNSLVSGAIPAFAVCSGVPAKVVRFR